MLSIAGLQRINLRSPFRCFPKGATALLLLLGAVFHAVAQQPASIIQDRIIQTIDSSALTTLKGNIHPLARPEFDRGAVNVSLPASRMQLVLKRSEGQEIALRQLLGSLQNPGSAQYRKWVTPEQLGAQYGISDGDIHTVSSWLAAQGLKVNSVNKAHTIIEFSGTVGQIQSAFHTQIHNFLVNGTTHMANTSDPQIPSALAPVVAGLSSLNNFFPRPQHTKPTQGMYDKATGELVPQLTTVSTADAHTLFVVPGDAATIYDTPNSFNANFKGSASYTGSGITVGIAGTSDIFTSTVTNYRNLFGLPAITLTTIVDGNYPGMNDADDEAYLDLEVSGAVAPNANLNFYIAADTNLQSGLFLAIERALNDNAVSILSVSFLGCEAFQGTTGNQVIYSLWEQAAAQGITVTVAAGDSGSAGCDDFHTARQAQDGFQVNGLASTPFDIAVGGTDYDVLANDFAKYVSTTNSSNFTSALGYIPEEPWNNSTNTNGLLNANNPFQNSKGDTNIVAGSGGPSSCVLPQYGTEGDVTGCGVTTGTSTGWPKPSWQIGGSLNIPRDNVRDIPDISLLAGNGRYNADWLVCTNDVDGSGGNSDCTVFSDGAFYFFGYGGTSASAPAFAGMLALVSQSQGGARLGQANYVLYNLANQSGLYASAFHDVTTGNNSVYCVSGSLNCGANLFETGYNTGPAYDFTTGLGSVDVSQLIDNWTKAAFTASTIAFTINGATTPVGIVHGQTVTLDATVAGGATVPTGDVAVISNANQQVNTHNSNGLGSFPLTNGTTGSVSYSNLPGGSYTLYANYGGDITNAQGQSSGVKVSVAKENSVLSLFGLSRNTRQQIPFPATFSYGAPFSIDAEPVGESQVSSSSPASATGVVTFTDMAGASASDGSGPVDINSLGVAELPVYYFSVGPHSVSANYAGDNSLNSSVSAAPLAFSIVQASTTNKVSANPASLTGGTFLLSSLITPTPATFAPAPSGIVTFVAGGISLGSVGISPNNPQTGASVAGVTIVIDDSSLAIGDNQIIATYAGDSNYAGSTGTLSVTYTPAPASFALTSTPATVSNPGQSGSSTVSITPTNYTGTVKLTCGLKTAPSGANATYSPSCNVPATVTVAGSTAATATATFATSAPSNGALASAQTNRWYALAGGTVFACVVFFGIPARRGGWKSMLCLLILVWTTAGIGCGSNNNHGTPGTTAGIYTFTITGTDSVTATLTDSTSVTLSVQ